MCLNINICNDVVSNETNVINFHPLEILGRRSETQLSLIITIRVSLLDVTFIWRFAQGPAVMLPIEIH